MIGFVSGVIAVVGVLLVERIGIDDPIGAVAAHGMAGVWGTLPLGFFAVPSLAKNLATGYGRPRLHGLASTSSASRRSASSPSAASPSPPRSPVLFVLKKTWGIRVEPEVETGGLDVHEHGMWGYPEFYIPVPGGYDAGSHSPWARSRRTRRATAAVVPRPSRSHRE